jgi:hypothetical protein
MATGSRTLQYRKFGNVILQANKGLASYSFPKYEKHYKFNFVAFCLTTLSIAKIIMRQ